MILGAKDFEAPTCQMGGSFGRFLPLHLISVRKGRGGGQMHILAMEYGLIEIGNS